MEQSVSAQSQEVRSEEQTAPAVRVVPIAATRDEIERLIAVEKEAFQADPFIQFCFHRPGAAKASTESQVRAHLEHIQDPRFRYYKAVNANDPQGPLLGITAWYIAEDALQEKVHSPFSEFPAGSHLECLDASIGCLRRWRYQYFRQLNQPYFYPIMLCVVPAAQRRGVGTALLNEGLKDVDQRGWHSYISASPAGLGLYKKLGWEEMKEVKVNLKDYGGEDYEAVSVGLIRYPRKGKDLTLATQPEDS